jgi:L-lactate utilization protein LutC
VEREAFLGVVSRRLEHGRAAQQDVAMPARPSFPADAVGLVELFTSRAEEVGATVHRVATRAVALDAVADLLTERGHGSLACPPTLRWPAIAGRWTADPREAPFGLSEADWGIAGTGSVVFRHQGPGGRGYSLVPPAVGILLAASRLLPDLGAVLGLIDEDPPPACITFMAGVSHSADIAGVPCFGVHGPASVDVWLIEDVEREGWDHGLRRTACRARVGRRTRP